MKIKNVQSIIFLVFFSLFANQAWAAEWIYFDTAAVGDVYYDKSSIKKVSENIISVLNKDVLSEKTKKKYFSLLKEIHKAPKNPSMLNYYTKLMEIDCVNKKIKDTSVILISRVVVTGVIMILFSSSVTSNSSPFFRLFCFIHEGGNDTVILLGPCGVSFLLIWFTLLLHFGMA